jgi:sulfur carrier protein
MDTVTITCTINGLEQKLPEGTSLADFLKSKGVPHRAVVVEVNKNILPKGDYEEIVLAHGDTVEIIQIIGGG